MNEIRTAAVLLAISATGMAAAAQEGAIMPETTKERLRLGAEVIVKLDDGAPQTTLENMREEFPFLADATKAYALGDVWTRPASTAAPAKSRPSRSSPPWARGI